MEALPSLQILAMRRVLFSLLLMATGHSLWAQDFYARAGIGYGFVQAGQTIDGTATPYSGTLNNSSVSSTDTMSFNMKKASYATGLHVMLAGGYMFNEFIGFDLSLDIGAMPKHYSFTENNTPINVGGSTVLNMNYTVNQHAKTPVLAIPAIVLQTGGSNLNLYTRTGLIVPLRTTVIQDQVYQTLPGQGSIYVFDQTNQIKNSFTLGLTAAMGLQYHLNERLMLWGEVSGISMALFTKTSTMTNITQNGSSYFSNIPDSVKVIHYSTNYSAQSGDQYHQPAYAQPFSNLCFTVGVKYLLTHNSADAAHRKTGKNYDDNDNY